jgi:hypothetical protein
VDEPRAIAAMKAGAHDYLMKDNLARRPGGGRSVPRPPSVLPAAAPMLALRRSEMDLRAVMEHVPDGLLTVSAGGLWCP